MLDKIFNKIEQIQEICGLILKTRKELLSILKYHQNSKLSDKQEIRELLADLQDFIINLHREVMMLKKSVEKKREREVMDADFTIK